MIYKIRVILDAKDDIFRDLAISSDDSLEDVHNAITQSFGLDGAEMASFYTCDENWNQEEEISLFDVEGSRNMSNTLIKDVIDEKHPKILYVYDFLLMWTFFIELADVTARIDGERYPYTLFSFGELPDSPPDKELKAEDEDDLYSDIDFDMDQDGEFGDFNDMDFDDQWN